MGAPDDIVTFADERVFRARAEAAFERHALRLQALLPTARVEHVGSTAVPGMLTKGDVDLCVLVRADELADAAARLGAAYAENVGSDRNEHLASFVAVREADEIDVGVQLVAEGSPFDMFVRWRELLRAHEPLRRDYDALKRRHDGGDRNAYRAAKAAFIEAALRDAARPNMPTFDEALAQFRARLREGGWPERILWTRAQDVARDADGEVTVYLTSDADDPAGAAREHERGRAAGGAPGIAAVCTLGDATCALVTTATPSASLPFPRREGRARWPVC
jgi:GrpB-like predicted nucleotidyltransferase (UPF0157 family)